VTAEAPQPEARPEPEPDGDPEAEPEPATSPVAPAAPAAAAERRPRPAAKPQERDPILEAALNLDNDQTMLVRMVALLARIGSRAFAHVDVHGLNHIPRRGPVILAVNHISNADPVVVGGWITDALKRRRIHWLGKRELFAWPVLGWVAAHGGIHPVDRDAADIDAFRLATKILDNGYVLLVFPEGTRSPTGELQTAKDGVAMLALRTGAQIVPIGVSNTDAVWRKGRSLPSPLPRRRVTVRIGTPFRLRDVIPEDVSRRQAKGLATTLIMGRIAALLDPRHRGVYAGAVPEDTAPNR
jgi:1-acyl-sn-glycerol-3-phosphate acyltransferase